MCKKRAFFICLMITFFLTSSGCNGSNTNEVFTQTPLPPGLTSIPTSTIAMDKTSQLRSAIVTPYPSSRPTLSRQEIDNKGMNTLIPVTVTPFHSPMPTLGQLEKDRIIGTILEEDYLCKLPCFAGINPGVTSLSDAKAFFETLALEPYHSSNSNAYSLELNHDQDKVLVGFYVSQDKINFIMSPRYSFPISKLLDEYGKPDEIYIHILDVLPIDKTVPYSVYLFYKKGIIAIYEGRSNNGSTVSVCMNGKDNNDVYFWLWNGNSNLTFKNIITQYVSKFYIPDVSSGYFSLSESGDLTIDKFFEIYSDKNQSRCLDFKNPSITP